MDQLTHIFVCGILEKKFSVYGRHKALEMQYQALILCLELSSLSQLGAKTQLSRSMILERSVRLESLKMMHYKMFPHLHSQTQGGFYLHHMQITMQIIS